MLSNATRLLHHWDIFDSCAKYAMSPAMCNLISWKGEALTSMSFVESANRYGTPFWDFHRADLHQCLYNRAVELGADVRVNSRVANLEFSNSGTTVFLSDGQQLSADLVVGADGLQSRTRECFLGRMDPPIPTGDLAYRVLFKTSDLTHDEDVKWILETSQVNYWMGPECHVVSYLLRGGELLNGYDSRY